MALTDADLLCSGSPQHGAQQLVSYAEEAAGTEHRVLVERGTSVDPIQAVYDLL